MTAKPTPAEQAASFMEAARRHGFGVAVERDLVRITKSFTPGDREAYVDCDVNGPSVMRLAPMIYPGTVWGTDGATIGGHAGMTGGYYQLNKSGVSKKFLSALKKLA